MGDSITASWEDLGKEAWERYFEPYGAINLGFAGDCTEDVIWRIENGELDGLSPKVLILKIGTNNTGHRRDQAEHTASDIKTICELIHKKLPDTHILLHALLPRGRKSNGPLRIINEDINRHIKRLATLPHISWIDVNHIFLDEEGIIPQNIMHDALHPNANQYLPWAQALSPSVQDVFAD